VPAHASVELATKSKCMACHDVDKKKMGPTFKDIAAKYKGDKQAPRPC
jgi:cytochrome c